MIKQILAGLFCLVLAGSVFSDNYTRESGDTSWSNLGQWNYYNGSAYVDAINYPTPSDLILMNGGKTLSVDTNAFAGTIKLPNATTDATLEFPSVGKTLTVDSLHIGNNTQAGNGTVNHSAGSLVATTLSLRPTGTKTGIYNLSGGTVTATNLEIGNSAAGATGTATFVQSGGTVTSPSITVGGSGSGTYAISGGTVNVSGTLDVIDNGQLMVVGTSAVVTATTLDTQPGSELVFKLSADGVGPLQISGNVNLADASISVDGSSYWGGATNFVLVDAGTLTSMASAGNISITGLVDASVIQDGDQVVLSIVESKTISVFDDTTGDGLWGTPGNWTGGVVPSGAVIAWVGDGLTATIASPPPAVDAMNVGQSATLVVRAEVTVPALRVEAQGTLKFEISTVGISPMTVTADALFDPSSQIIVDGSAYEGMDGYFPLILSSNLTGSVTNDVSFVGFGAREPAVVVEDDGLWLRLIAPPSLSQRLCSLVPDSTVAVDWSNTVFSATREYDPSGSAWSLSLSEAHVMDARLSCSDPDSSVSSWDLRVARGGNIYSLRTDALGETVPPSYRAEGDTSPWNDEVWQAVAVDTSQNDTANGNPYFMHQSGVYLRDADISSEPFYSPQMAAVLNEEERTYTTINWTPQAHIYIYNDDNPSNDVKSYLLMFTRYRDLGQGVIEVTQGDYNYGPDTLDFLNMPWGGVRRTTTEYAFLADSGGTTWSAPLTNSFGAVALQYNTTGGWMGYSATSNGVTPSLGFVFGSDHDIPLPEQKYSYSTFRPGYAGTPAHYQPTETNWRNYFVTSCIRWYNLIEGRGFWSRYYFVLGDDMQDLSDRIADRNLVDAQMSTMNYTESETPLVAYSFSGTGSAFRVVENSQKPQFFLYAYPITDSVPIFEIIEDDESRYLTWNPYANGIVKPYDGTIAGMRLLGFAMQNSGTNGTYAALSGLLPSENYLADGKTLYARTATPFETWRVEYFGYTDAAGDGANTSNPDSDELNNLGEYALGGNPINPADIGYLPTGGIYDAGGVTNFFDYVYARRIGSEGELDYSLEVTTDLVDGTWTNRPYDEFDPRPLNSDFEAITNRLNITDQTNEFIRLKIDAL